MKKKYPATSRSVPIHSRKQCKNLTASQSKHLKQLDLSAKRSKKDRLALILRGLPALITQSKPSPLLLPGQPLDALLLSLSSLYTQSRKLFIQHGGTYLPSLISSPRTLSSVALLGKEIEYSPIEREYFWAAQDPHHLRDRPDSLYELRLCISNVFHEQNHRILWEFLPKPPKDPQARRRYLNFVESLVVTLDMALGDELGDPLSGLLHEAGVIYDPGTLIKNSLSNAREYRNYLQAATYTTYLNLEHFPHDEIRWIIERLYIPTGPTLKRACERGLRLDEEFVFRTNPLWQEKHAEQVFVHFKKRAGQELIIPEDPLDHCSMYLWTEKWMDLMGL